MRFEEKLPHISVAVLNTSFPTAAETWEYKRDLHVKNVRATTKLVEDKTTRVSLVEILAIYKDGNQKLTIIDQQRKKKELLAG